MPAQTCKKCKWFYNGQKSGRPNACYYDGKWQKWLKKGSEDKPNACPKFEN